MEIRESGKFCQDKIADELSLVIDAGFGHRSIVNILRQAQKLTANNNVYAVIGGIHLFRASEERIQKTIAEFKTRGVKELGVCHCTGFHASVKSSKHPRKSFS